MHVVDLSPVPPKVPSLDEMASDAVNELVRNKWLKVRSGYLDDFFYFSYLKKGQLEIHKADSRVLERIISVVENRGIAFSAEWEKRPVEAQVTGWDEYAMSGVIFQLRNEDGSSNLPWN